MSGEIRRGKAAIQEAAKSQGGGGDFKPFLKAIYWKEDKEERYLLFLTPMDESPQFDMIQFIETERGYPEMAVAKTDPYFGERKDQFVEQWDATPRTTNIAIAVELEPTVEMVKGRRKPTGFEVMTEEFSRKVVDDDGELTEETEEVTTPVIGVITQSPKNFFNVLESCDNTDFPVHETPVKITRVGKDSNTSYQVTGYESQEIDLTNLVEFLDGITYLGEDLDDLIEKIDGQEPFEQAQAIGTVLLDKKLEELLDEERYDELFEGVTESMDKFGNKKKEKKDRKAPNRAARPSQRRAKKAETEAEDEAPAEEPQAAKVTSSSPPEDKLDALKKKAAARAAK